MNGHSTGLESADTGRTSNHGFGDADVANLRSAKAALEARGEWRLAREIEDALARWDSEAAERQQALALGEGERGSEALHGENPQNAKVICTCGPSDLDMECPQHGALARSSGG